MTPLVDVMLYNRWLSFGRDIDLSRHGWVRRSCLSDESALRDFRDFRAWGT